MHTSDTLTRQPTTSKKGKPRPRSSAQLWLAESSPNSCVLVVGMSIKDLDEDGDDQYMYYLVIPTDGPSKQSHPAV